MDDKHQRSAVPPLHPLHDPAQARRRQAGRQEAVAEKYMATESLGIDFKPSPPGKANRTDAQREASRRNGARSRGPVTAEGKARSAANSLKHGLLAKLLSPPGDPREHDRLFRRIRKELLEEFKPATFTERAAVEKLAKLYLQSGRAEELIESLQRPACISQKDAEAYRKLQDDRRNIKHLKRVLLQLDHDEPLACDRDLADLLAERVGLSVESLQEILSEPTVPIAEMTEYELEEDRGLKRQWAKVRPVKALLTDRGRLSKILMGETEATPAVKRQLHDFLHRLAQGDGQRIERNAGIEQSVIQARQRKVLNLANEPETLMLLQRYANGIERMIGRMIARLR